MFGFSTPQRVAASHNPEPSCAGDWLAAHRAAVHDRNPKEMQQLLRNPQLLPLHLAPLAHCRLPTPLAPLAHCRLPTPLAPLAHCRLPTPLSIPTSLLPQMVFQLSDDVMQGLRIFATLLGALGLVAAICTACQRTLEPVQVDSLHSRSPLDPALHYTL